MAISYPDAKDLVEGTTDRSFAAVTSNAADYLVVEVISEDAVVANVTPSASGLVFTKQNDVGTASHVRVQHWTAPDASGGSRTVLMTNSNGTRNYRARLTVVRGSDGPGGKNTSGTTQTVSLTRTGNNSGVFMTVGDWSAGAVGTPAWTPGGSTTASQQGSAATYVFGRWDDSGASGTASHGISSPTYTTPAVAALEMLATATSTSVDAAGPWTRPTPGRLGPTGLWTPQAPDFQSQSALAAAEAAGTGAAADAQTAVAPNVDTSTGTGTALAGAPDFTVNADATAGVGTANDGQAAVSPNSDTTTAAGVATDAAADVGVNADTTTGVGTAYDATVVTTTEQQYAGPWIGPTPGRIGPTGSWTVILGDAYAPQVGQATAEAATATAASFDAAVNAAVPADTTTSAGTAFDASVSIGPAAEVATGAATANASTLDASIAAGLATATGAALDAVLALAAAVDVALAAAVAYDPTTPGAIQDANATSTAVVSAGRTSSSTTSASRTSTGGVTARRTSTSDVSDG